MISDSDAVWSCVVDDTPAIWSSIVPWLVTAIKIARIPPSRIHVHHVCALRPDIAKLCQSLSVHTHKIEPFDRRFPHTNKILQCFTDFANVSRVVLMDVDMVFAGRLPLDLIHASVAGKLVDEPNPPMEILRDVFAAANLPLPPACRSASMKTGGFLDSFETLPGNYNGGLYMVDRAILGRLGEAWTSRARWLISRIELLDRWAVHVDQVSFCLAVNELHIELEQLDAAWNFPLHLKVETSGIEPYILHHHAALDDRFCVHHSSDPRVQHAVARVNDAIRTFL